MGVPSPGVSHAGLQLAGPAQGQQGLAMLAVAPLQVPLALARHGVVIREVVVVDGAVGVEHLLDLVGGAEVGRQRLDAVVIPGFAYPDCDDEVRVVLAGPDRDADSPDGLDARGALGESRPYRYKAQLGLWLWHCWATMD